MNTATDWTHIEPLLDKAMEALEDTDRAALLLRYFENKPLREVGQALGATTTPRKNVSAVPWIVCATSSQTRRAGRSQRARDRPLG